MGSTGVPDSTVGAITDADIMDAGLKGARDSSTAASGMAIAALKGAEGSNTVVPEMAIAAFTAVGISVEVPADSMAAAGATAADTDSFPEFLIS
jgi:hypothetical protein